MTITQHSPLGLLAADVAALTAKHLTLLSGAEKLADRLTADMPLAEVIAELRAMTAEARSLPESSTSPCRPPRAARPAPPSSHFPPRFNPNA